MVYSGAEDVGIDIGKGYIKYVWHGGSGEIRSLHSFGNLTSLTPSREVQASNLVLGDKEYILGDHATLGRNCQVQDDERKDKEANIAFILSVLARIGVHRANIMVGLPVSQESESAAVKKRFNGTHNVIIGGKNGKPATFEINTEVMAEPKGTYMSLICNEFGQINKANQYFQKTLAICDIGHSTLDIVVVQNGIFSDKQSSELMGVSGIYRSLWREMESTHGKIKINEQMKIINALVNPGANLPMTIDGVDIDPGIWGRVKQLKMESAESILNSMQSVLGDLRPEITIITGGGGLFLLEEFKKLNPSVTLHGDARFANAIGFYRGLKYKRRQQGAA